MTFVSILPHVEFGSNDHREYASRLNEFNFKWLENSVIEKAALIPLMFNHLKWNPSYLFLIEYFR